MLMLSNLDDLIFIRDDVDEITQFHRKLKESGQLKKHTLMMAAASKGTARAFAHLMNLGEDPLQADAGHMTAALYQKARKAPSFRTVMDSAVSYCPRWLIRDTFIDYAPEWRALIWPTSRPGLQLKKRTRW